MANRVWFITGASSGFGRVLAEEALARGDQVAATARNPDSLADLVTANPDGARAIRLDVTDPVRIGEAVAEAVAAFGQIDVAVNNAGYGMIGAIEEVSDADTRAMFETHVFGTLGVIRAVLPQMRARRSGMLINMSSLAGLTGFSGGGIYAGCKFAIEGFTEAIEEELKPFGIKVLLVEPGSFRTDFFSRSIQFSEPMNAYAGGPIAAKRNAVKSHADLPEPIVAIRAIFDAVERAEHDGQPLRLIIGADALRAARAKIDRLNREIGFSEDVAEANRPS